LSREHYRKNRSNESEIWYKPVVEKKQGPGKGRRIPGRRKSVPQHKLLNFIQTKFGGNISEAARQLGIRQQRLYVIVNRGVLKRATINKLVDAAKRIDPSQTEKRLFVPPRIIPRQKKKKVFKQEFSAPVIRPSMGGFVSIGPSPLSAAIARAKDLI